MEDGRSKMAKNAHKKRTRMKHGNLQFRPPPHEPSPPHEPRNLMWPPHPVPLPRGGEGVISVGESVVLGCNAQILLGNSHPDLLPQRRRGRVSLPGPTWHKRLQRCNELCVLCVPLRLILCQINKDLHNCSTDNSENAGKT